MRVKFVSSVFIKLLKEGILSNEDSILSICGGVQERDLFLDLGFKNVTISNYDNRIAEDSLQPFNWSHQNAEKLTFCDGEFDFVFVSDGLHHLYSPHKAITEMYRVSSKGIIVIESKDNVMIRLACFFRLSQQYEISSVISNNFIAGGVNNSNIPNYVYRWTEREFMKTINSYNPIGKHRYYFYHDINLPRANSNRYIVRLLYVSFGVILKPVFQILKKYGNTLCMIAIKPKLPDELYPWLRYINNKICFNREYIK